MFIGLSAVALWSSQSWRYDFLHSTYCSIAPTCWVPALTPDQAHSNVGCHGKNDDGHSLNSVGVSRVCKTSKSQQQSQHQMNWIFL